MAFDGLPLFNGNVAEWCRRVQTVVNRLLQGKTNNVLTFTLTAGATSTIVNVPPSLIGNESLVAFFPESATAATAFGSGSMYVVTDPANNRFTVSHASTADTDKNFRYAIIG